MFPAATPKNRLGAPSASNRRGMSSPLRDDPHPEALRLQQAPDYRHAKAGVIDVGVPGDDDNVAAIPSERIHFGAQT